MRTTRSAAATRRDLRNADTDRKALRNSVFGRGCRHLSEFAAPVPAGDALTVSIATSLDTTATSPEVAVSERGAAASRPVPADFGPADSMGEEVPR
ncbi:hypothetical protein [Nocardia sp. NBC_00511]|uniref:hypothetical protein n=1 Tax=Nocardia sp. NBC_00511 TaxID=2903591 RepID=UPI0030DF820C